MSSQVVRCCGYSLSKISCITCMATYWADPVVRLLLRKEVHYQFISVRTVIRCDFFDNLCYNEYLIL